LGEFLVDFVFRLQENEELSNQHEIVITQSPELLMKNVVGNWEIYDMIHSCNDMVSELSR